MRARALRSRGRRGESPKLWRSRGSAREASSSRGSNRGAAWSAQGFGVDRFAPAGQLPRKGAAPCWPAGAKRSSPKPAPPDQLDVTPRPFEGPPLDERAIERLPPPAPLPLLHQLLELHPVLRRDRHA